MGTIGWPQLLIVGLLILLLFGARRLPELARGLGSSLRIFRAETKGLLDDEDKSTPQVSAGNAEQPAQPRPAEPTAQAEPVERPADSSNRDA